MKPLTLTAALVFMPLALLGHAAETDDSSPAISKPSDLDRQLLDDLGGELVEGLPAGPSQGESPAAGEEKPGSKPAPPPLDQPDEGEDIGSESADPLIRIGRRMRAVQMRIDARDTSRPTQQIQRQIADELAALIQQLQQAQSQQQQRQGRSRPSGGRGGQPGDTERENPEGSDERVGPAPETELRPELTDEMIKKVWGHLPQRVRDAMLSGASEEVLPKYRKLIEEYYKRLAEDRRDSP